MQSTPKKLQKLRTFQSDLTAAQGPVPAVVPIPTPPPQDSKIQLPPVLNKKEPEPPLPPIKVAAPSLSPVVVKEMVVPKPTSTPTVAATLQNQIDTVLHVPERQGVEDPTRPMTKVTESLIQTRPLTPTVTKEPVWVMDTVGSEGLRGTVITNQKRGRFKLLPSIWEALQQWFKDTEHSIEKRAEKKRLAIPTVRTIEDRRETIKKAASVGALAPKDAQAKLVVKPLRQTQPETPSSAPTLIIAEKEAVPAPSWSHYEGGEQKLTPKPEPTTPTPLPQPELAPPVIPPLPSKVEASATIVPELAPTTPVSVTPTESVPTEVILTNQNAVEPVRLEIGKTAQSKVFKAKPPLTGRNFRWLFYIGVATTAIVATLCGAGLVTWLLGESATPVVPVAVTDLPDNFVTPVPQSPVVKLAMPRTRGEWYDDVLSVDQGNLTTIMPTTNIGGAERPVTTEEILTMMSLKVEPALIRSIKEMTFMLVDEKPAIILKVSAYDATFGGLLLSESVLSTELAPLFGTPVNATYKVGVGTVSPEFIDELAENHDVRVLNDEMENERLVYGFINQNTVVITTDKEAFSALASRLR